MRHLKFFASLVSRSCFTKITVSIDGMEDGAASCLFDGISRGAEPAPCLHHDSKHCCSLLLLSGPEGQQENFQSTVPSVQEMFLPETSNARFHLKKDGNKGRQEGLLCFLADNSPGRPDHGQWSELGKRRPPLHLSEALTHTRALLGTGPGREQAGTTWWNVYPPVCLSSQHPGLTPGKAQTVSPGSGPATASASPAFCLAQSSP